MDVAYTANLLARDLAHDLTSLWRIVWLGTTLEPEFMFYRRVFADYIERTVLEMDFRLEAENLRDARAMVSGIV